MDTPSSVHILAPTRLERWAAQRELPGWRVVHTGIALRRWPGVVPSCPLIVCGLAGALVSDLSAGTVLVPTAVGLPDGSLHLCDPTLASALVAGARRLGLPVDTRPMLTAPHVVTGPARAEYARQGHVGVDMETALLTTPDRRVATVRVVLDTPARSFAAVWERPLHALVRPAAWRDIMWLARTAPPYARRAARVIRAAFADER